MDGASAPARPAPAERVPGSPILTIASVLGIVAALVFYLGWEFAHRGLAQYATTIYPFDDADEWRYTACSRLVEHGYAIFSQVFSAQPPLLFETLAAGMRLTSDSITGARIVEVAFGLLAIGAVIWLGWQLLGPVAAGAAALLLAVSPAFLVYSRAVEAEGPMMALMTFSLALAVTSGRRRNWPLALVSGICLAAAVLVKLFALEAVFPAVWALLFQVGRASEPKPANGAGSSPEFVENPFPRIAAFAAGSIVPIAADFALVAPAQQWSQVIAMHANAGTLPLTRTINTVQVVGQFLGLDLGLTLLAVAGVLSLLIARRFNDAIFLLLWVVGIALMLLLFRPLFPHHPAILLTGLAVSAGIGIGMAVRGARRHRGGVAAPILLAVLAYLALAPRLIHADRHVLLPGYRQNALVLVPYVAAHASPHDLIAADDLAVADLAGRLVAPPLCDPSNVRLQSGYLTAAELVGATTRYRVRLVLPSFGIFIQVHQYLHWLRSHYHSVPAPDRTTAYYRK